MTRPTPHWAGWSVISWPGFAVLAAYSGVAMFLSNPDLRGSSVSLRLLASAAGLLILFASLIAARSISGRVWSGRHPALVVAGSFVAASLIRAATVAVLLQAFGVTDQIRWPQRLPAAVIGFTTALLVTTAALGSLAEARSRRVLLIERRATTLRARNLVLAETDRDWASTSERIRAQLLDSLQVIPEQGSDPAASHLRAIADEVVRPMSRELAQAVETVDLGRDPVAVRVSLSELTMHATRGRPLSPGWTTALFSAFGGPFLFSALSLQQAAWVMTLGAVAAWCLLTLGNWTLGRVLPRRGPLSRALIIVAVVITIGALLAASTPWLVDAPDDVVARIMLGDITLIPTLAIALVAARMAQDQRASTDAALMEAADELAWQLARARCVQWQGQRRLSQAMHGPVQSALAWGAARIEAAPHDPEAMQEIVTSVRERIVAALTYQEARPGLEETLSNLAATWSGVCDFQWEPPGEVMSALDEDPVARDTVRELILEACWNAIRHGHATTISVQITREPTALKLRIIDDGGGNDDGPPGLGTRMFTEMTIRFTRTSAGGSTVLTLLVPVEPQLP